MALITSDCGTSALLEHQLALITSGCAGELWVEEPDAGDESVARCREDGVRWPETETYYGLGCLLNLGGIFSFVILAWCTRDSDLLATKHQSTWESYAREQ